MDQQQSLVQLAVEVLVHLAQQLQVRVEQVRLQVVQEIVLIIGKVDQEGLVEEHPQVVVVVVLAEELHITLIAQLVGIQKTVQELGQVVAVVKHGQDCQQVWMEEQEVHPTVALVEFVVVEVLVHRFQVHLVVQVVMAL
jgi:hypothetical protein